MSLPRTSQLRIVYVIEGALIVLAWYLLVGSVWHDGMVPGGVEFPRNMHSLYVWEYLQQCGSCAWWAPVGGGYPVFADVFGSFLHPIAVLSTWVQGAVVASATTVALAFLMIALAAWWFGVHFDLHPMVRVWLAIAAMYGGHMTVRLELGTVGLPLSLAAAWLCVVALVTYMDTPSWRRAVVVGVAAGWCAVSGQGYLQLALVLSLPIWAVWWWRWVRPRIDNHERLMHLYIATGIAVLLTAPLILGVLSYGHFFGKYGDPSLSMAQPIAHIVVNWLVDTYAFTKSDIVNPFPYPWAYSVFIGWVPLLAAVSLWGMVRTTRTRELYQMLAMWGLYLLVWASMWPLQQLLALDIAPITRWVTSLRFMVILNGLATMVVLSLAALGLHALIQHPLWRRFTIRIAVNRSQWQIGLNILLGVLLLSNLMQQYRFGKTWITEVEITDADQQRIVRDLAELPPGYVELEADWLLLSMLEQRVKINNMHMSWWMDGRVPPPALYQVSTSIAEGYQVVREYWDGWMLTMNSDVNADYATFIGDDGIPQACDFQSQGGFVDVTCDTSTTGYIRVYEYALPGWRALRNDMAVSVTNLDGWVVVPVDAPGLVTVQLRFTSWQASVGLLLHVLGYAVAVALWWYRPPWTIKHPSVTDGQPKGVSIDEYHI